MLGVLVIAGGLFGPSAQPPHAISLPSGSLSGAPHPLCLHSESPFWQGATFRYAGLFLLGAGRRLVGAATVPESTVCVSC